MSYLPVFLDVSGRRCVVIGGGHVAERRTVALLDAGADVTVVSPQLTDSLAAMVRRGSVRHLDRTFHSGDLSGATLVYAATDDPEVNRGVAAEARASGIPLNVADVPELCSFLTPAMVKRGALQIAISTGGKSPAMAAHLRRYLESIFGPEYETVLEILGSVRDHLRLAEPESAQRACKLAALAASPLAQYVRAGDREGIGRILTQHLGSSFKIESILNTLDFSNSAQPAR
ncbi:MAG TPA: bifunctional precorrin-2 dehydrogenase/sirohydrochlorin ferrochelatase [Candidatus Binataceae bacterium]